MDHTESQLAIISSAVPSESESDTEQVAKQKKKKILSVSITVLRLSCCFTLRVHIVQRSVCQTERAKEEEGIAAGGWQESVEEAV